MIALFAHLLFFFVIAPRLNLDKKSYQKTEVVQISADQLQKLKADILRNKQLPPLLRQELREQFKSKEAPKDPKFIGAFNQVVPKETMAAPQKDAPQDGSGSQSRQQEKQKSSMKLSDLGFQQKTPPVPQGHLGPQRNGPQQDYRPVGRSSKDLRSQDNLLNAAESKYYSFFSRFEEPIVANWYFLMRQQDAKIRGELMQKRVTDGTELPVTVEFVLDRAGNFLSVEIVQSSGIPTLDWSTREAVAKLRNLPNPPAEIFEGKNTFSYRLSFALIITGDSYSRPGMSWF